MKIPKYFIGIVEAKYKYKNIIIEVYDIDDKQIILFVNNIKYLGTYDFFNDVYILEYIKSKIEILRIITEF